MKYRTIYDIKMPYGIDDATFYTEWDKSAPPAIVACGYDQPTKVDLSELEKANNFIQNLTQDEQALLYKALYLNDMRIDKAEQIIRSKKLK